MTEDIKIPRFGIEINFWDNDTREDVNRGTMSNSSYSIIDELEQMIALVKELNEITI